MPDGNSRVGVFRHRSFAVFWAAGLASNTGTWLHVITSTIVVYQYTQSTAALGFLGFASYLPLLLFTLPAGVLSDRFDRRAIVIVSHVLGVLAAGALALLVHLDVRSVEAIAIAGFAVYTTYAVAKPAISSIFPALVPREEIAQATAVNSLSYVLGQLFGPLLASVCIALGAPALAFALNALSYVAVIVVVGRLERSQTGLATRSHAPLVDQVRGGFQYVMRTPSVRAMLVILLVAAPPSEVMRLFAPAISDRVVGGEELAGFIAAAIGLGAASGLTLAARYYEERRLRTTITVGLAALGISSLLLVSTDSPVVAFGSAVTVGLGFSLAFGALSASIQTTVPDDLRGRVMSIHTLVQLGTRPLFTPVAGALAVLIGLSGATLVFALALPLGLVAMFRTDRAAGRSGSPPVAEPPPTGLGL
jgi:MFS family permease